MPPSSRGSPPRPQAHICVSCNPLQTHTHQVHTILTPGTPIRHTGPQAVTQGRMSGMGSTSGPLFLAPGQILALDPHAYQSPVSWGLGRTGGTCHADFQPSVGCREEEGGNVVGVGVFKELLLEPALVSGGRTRSSVGHVAPETLPAPDMPSLPPYVWAPSLLPTLVFTPCPVLFSTSSP